MKWLTYQLSYFIAMLKLMFWMLNQNDAVMRIIKLLIKIIHVMWSSTLLAPRPSVSPHVLQVLDVFLPRLPERRHTVVPDPKLLTGLLEQRGDPEVMTLGHVREEVMCRLMVDPPRHDVPEPTVGAVVNCGYHLKLSPIMQKFMRSISPYGYII